MGDTDDDTATDSATDAINTSDDEGNYYFPELIAKNLKGKDIKKI